MQKRGQTGDPLSPLLFVLAADFFQVIVNKGWQMDLIKHPLSEDFGGGFPVVQMLMTLYWFCLLQAQLSSISKVCLEVFLTPVDYMSTSANLFLCQLMSQRKKAHILPKPLDVMLVPCHSPIWAFHLAQLSPPFWISVLWLQRLKGDLQASVDSSHTRGDWSW